MKGFVMLGDEFLYQKQKFKHSKEDRVSGDCYRTCIACLLRVPRDTVPLWYAELDWFNEDEPISQDAVKEMDLEILKWLRKTHGVSILDIPFDVVPADFGDRITKAVKETIKSQKSLKYEVSMDSEESTFELVEEESYDKQKVEADIQSVLNRVDAMTRYSNAEYILSGKSFNRSGQNVNHSVVCRGNKIIHNTSLHYEADGNHFSGPCLGSDKYHVEFLIKQAF